MYRKYPQPYIDFLFSATQLNPSNEWIQMSKAIDWSAIEDRYARNFTHNGRPAFNVRIAFGSLMIKKILGCSDRWTVRHITENPYLQYFIGMKSFQMKCPFSVASMVHFRRRLDEEDIDAVIEETLAKLKVRQKAE